MRKIAIIGCGGAGKSTFSRQLGKVLELEVFHLDKINWKPGWVETPREELRVIQEQLVKKESWIFDGNYGTTMDVRLNSADTIIFLDMSRLTCMYRIVKRRWMYHKKERPDIGEGCEEKLDLEFIRWVWNFRKNRRPQLLEKIASYKANKNVIILRSRKEVETFLEVVRMNYTEKPS
ncbi:DNA topology modulation protein [Pseudalkalibacillus decolorationis]|uniref:DNA topology modulation protein n=1 Tax=Pseudalkalibacillus decolorationis TaxID=163879 RepID=UPI002147DB62|nr:DNA topology modulation protein [Pseudalkalibacillus decolorationis]